MRSSWFTRFQSRKDSKTTATVALFRRHDGLIEVLLGKRKMEPEAGKWSLPGGHVLVDESDEEGARRELKEETGMSPSNLVYIGFRAEDEHRGSENHLFATFLPVNFDQDPQAGTDIGEVKWVPVTELPVLAFDNNRYVLIALARLIEKKTAFSTLPARFGSK